MALVENWSFNAAGSIIDIVYAHSCPSLGGLGSWQTDRYLLYLYFLLCSFFYRKGNRGEKLGKPLYVDGMYCIWDGIAD